MNKLEFNTVMETLKIEKIKTLDYVNYKVYIYKFGKFNISFTEGKYYAVIKGDIPLEVANIIYNKYQGNPHRIRVCGGQDELIPDEWARDGYIEDYHIDTKEGLLIFLTEMMDYYNRKNNLPECFVKQYQSFLNTISFSLIETINPSLSINEWMKDAKKPRWRDIDSHKLYLESIKSSEDDVDEEIRENLVKFDYAVNPFQCNDIDLNNSRNIFEKISVYGSTFDKVNGMKRENCAVMSLHDFNSKSYVKYIRNPDGFYYIMNYNLPEIGSITVRHYFTNSYSDDFSNGEIISIEYYKNGEFELDVRYNITQKKFKDNEGIMDSIYEEQKKFILEKLEEAVNLAASITLDNFKNVKNIRKLSK